MSFYEINLGVLVVVNIALYSHQRRLNSDELLEKDANGESKQFLTTYLVAYLLATGSDWLQGPHIYAIYRYDKELEETTTAALYATGFIAGAVSSAFVGQLADKYGRRLACIVYCVSYVLCCSSMLSDDLIILFLGRIAGGVGTTLLYTCFESWMITEYYTRELDSEGPSTATVFGHQTTLNSVVAILSGIVGELLVSSTDSRKTPFLLAGLLAVFCGCWISVNWNENYGHSDEAETTSRMAIVDAAKTIWNDKNVLALTTASSIFESMMYLFVFFWSAAITSAHLATGGEDDPPLGIIFSCFMCAMMAGSQVFNMSSRHCGTFRAAAILEVAMTLASLALVSTVLAQSEYFIFWAFCIVELCVGLYFPSMSFLKGNLIEDGTRAKLYSLMRLPLNVLVVVTHSMAEEGDRHRRDVFLTFGTGVIIAFVVVRRFIA